MPHFFLWSLFFLVSFGIVAKDFSEAKKQNTSNKISQATNKKEFSNNEPFDERQNMITVTGTRREGLLKDSAITTEVISRKDIDDMGAKDLSEAVRNIPGVNVRPATSGERGETIQIQGLSAQNVLILVDGQRTTGRFNGAIDLTRFKAEEIERIEIVKGSSSAIYGSDAIAGVINIITKEAISPFSANFRTLGGTGSKKYYSETLDFRNTGSVGVKTENYSTNFTAGWHRGEGYDLTLDATKGPRNGRIASTSGAYNPFPHGMSKREMYYLATNAPSYSFPLESTSGNSFNDLNVANKSILHVKENVKLTSQFYYRYLDQSGVDAVLPRTIYDRNSKTHDFMGALNLDWAITQKLNLTLNTNYSRFQDLYTMDQRKADDLDSKQRTDNTVIEERSKLDYKFSENHVLSFGAENLTDQISSARISPDCKREFPNICLSDIRPELFQSQVINGYADRFRHAFYVQDEWRISDAPRIQIVPGVRYDRDSIYGGQWLPKLAVRFDTSENFRIRAASGLGYRAPSFQDLYYNFFNPGVGYRVTGNDQLKPELSRTNNLGFEWDINRKIWLSSNLFYNSVSNLIGLRLSPSNDSSGMQVYKSSNYLKAKTGGLESSINFRLNSFLSFGLGYTYTSTKDEITNLPLEGRTPHRWNANIKIDHKPTGFGVSLFAVSFGKSPYYCTNSFLGCTPDLPEYLDSLESEITTRVSSIQNNFINSLNIPKPVSDYCTERNQVTCTSNTTYGYRMVNAHTNINLRISQKFANYFQWFFGVENVLDSWDTKYNPQKPRYFYFGLDTKFEIQEENNKG
ncbi:MAG: TonB-dependent receptor [Leptospiraceae bacterium]|nr:TonB-dependent receptor [Leptospiraceae bacterium]MCK6381800.1 TonB-dependent receptor [Leptospiraceae bacterium]NUM41708.1 TonB-dependent receptor [Leptospiraceae bacterium]